MRAVVQRVASAHVEVDSEIVGAIQQGLLVYLAAGKQDADEVVPWMVQKLSGLRIFEDAAGKMSLSVKDVRGALLVVSQFTLYGDVRKGRRPSFDGAAPPERAVVLYEAVCAGLQEAGFVVQTGRFRERMRVHAEVEGPVTILVDSERSF